MSDYELFQIEISKNYTTVEWRDDLKRLLLKAGAEGKNTVFLFSDNQIKDESFVEDINMILNTGDVPNLYPSDEKAEIIEKMQQVARVEVCLLSSPYEQCARSSICSFLMPRVVRLMPLPCLCTTCSSNVSVSICMWCWHSVLLVTPSGTG